MRTLTSSQHAALTNRLQELYQHDLDPGVHSATHWVLKQWLEEQPRPPELTGRALIGARRWFRNGLGQDMVLVTVPPTAEEMRINVATAPLDGHTIAIDVNEITQAQFLQFRTGHTVSDKTASDQPVRGVSWFDAIAFCQWMNQQNGIPESEWCYLPNEHGKFDQGVQLAANFMFRKGYRLLTEREWLLAAAAGAASHFFFGDDPDSLDSFGWSAKMARSSPAAIGEFYLNSFGLFDVHGNVAEWCHDSVPQTEPETEQRRTLGGSFAQLPWQLQGEYGRSSAAPSDRNPQTGFRVARTVVGSTLDVFAEVEKAGRRGDWPAVERECEIALKERPNEWAYRLIMARIKLYLGDEDGCEEICRSLAEQLNDPQRREEFTPRTTDDRIAYTIAAVWLGSPNVMEHFQTVQALTDAAKNYGSSGMRNVAILEFRQGNYRQAAQQLAQQTSKDRSYGLAINLYFQAMANHKLDRPDDALRLLHEASATFAELSRSVPRGDYGVRWRDWAYCTTLDREARGMLGFVE